MVRELLVGLFTGQLRSGGKDLVSFENCQTRLFYSVILFRQENPQGNRMNLIQDREAQRDRRRKLPR